MKILINNPRPSIGIQLFDAWNAYEQSRASYKNNNQYTFLTDTAFKFNKEDYNLSVLFEKNSKTLSITDAQIQQYDIVLICNRGEPLSVSSPALKYLLQHNNVFLIANSYLSDEVEIKNKVIWFPDEIMTCRDYWTRHFYPQYYDLCKQRTDEKTNSLFYINGANRTVRQLFMDYLAQLNLDITIKNSVTEQICEIGESCWESSEDTKFRTWVNQKYSHSLIEDFANTYYDQSVSVGIDDRFGKIPPGHFHLPLYFQHACVIFPETSWQNNELSITEKALKCFYAETLPLPVAGANINRLYNEIGFYTAWNLLPEEMQKFDGILDHDVRYQQLSHAVAWLHNNPEVFDSEQYRCMTQQNKLNFLTCECDYQAVIRFDQILANFVRQ